MNFADCITFVSSQVGNAADGAGVLPERCDVSPEGDAVSVVVTLSTGHLIGAHFVDRERYTPERREELEAVFWVAAAVACGVSGGFRAVVH